MVAPLARSSSIVSKSVLFLVLIVNGYIKENVLYIGPGKYPINRAASIVHFRMPKPRRSRNKTCLAFSSLLSPLEVNMSSKIKSVVSIVILLFILPNFISQNQAQQVSNHSIPAFYVFGDSYVDPGNNDYILSIAKSNFPPYGIDYPNHIATGRFSNGKLIADFFGGT
ncbi:hypothetical protein RHSIM_Rhsim13G0182800 [Rhododendron simsii]|uniref:GDSL esterase/lipase n=1 Tax=Rhododendron simsii TaxID=118357 RepID=A0A834L743_RHOSS|nr:hypothetical protein RHSIM_Rhsim13G0182800 [Rhododendron simsii]